MTDLPRFTDGKIGKLEFHHLNEMMRRLDALLPVVQSVANGGGWSGKERPLIFPVFAERTADVTRSGQQKYDWKEVTMLGDTVAYENEGFSVGDTVLRSGKGVLAVDPRNAQSYGGFDAGLAIAFVIKSIAEPDKTETPSIGEQEDKDEEGVRYLLFPVVADRAKPGLCMITGTPSTIILQIGATGERECDSYPAILLEPTGDTTGEQPDLEVFDTEIELIDLNSSKPNEPIVDGSDPSLLQRKYESGTIFFGKNIGQRRYAFTHLPRYDVVCAGGTEQP